MKRFAGLFCVLASLLIIACGVRGVSTALTDPETTTPTQTGGLTACNECDNLANPGPTMCTGVCVNTMHDQDNCGGCGVACNAGQICNNGACQNTCTAGSVSCGGVCTNTQSSQVHCGACNFACANNKACINGSCM